MKWPWILNVILSDVTLILLYLGILQPGLQLSTYFSFVSLFNMSIFFQTGQGYFYKRKKKYGSVFRVNMGVKGVHICDRTGIKVLFDMDKVGKSEVFVSY